MVTASVLLTNNASALVRALSICLWLPLSVCFHLQCVTIDLNKAS